MRWLANAGRGLGRAFLDQDFGEIRRVVDTNVTGTIYLVHKIGREMRAHGQGRILITGSIAGFMPGTYQAVYNGTMAFLDLFSYALRAELDGCGVTVTCLMPGATETDPAEVAASGFKATEKAASSRAGRTSCKWRSPSSCRRR
jgi:short-subunit dehydrogenase